MPPPSDPSKPASRGCARPTDTDAAPPLRPVKSEALLDDALELLIDHRGTVYRLRQTALGKLILTK